MPKLPSNVICTFPAYHPTHLPNQLNNAWDVIKPFDMHLTTHHTINILVVSTQQNEHICYAWNPQDVASFN